MYLCYGGYLLHIGYIFLQLCYGTVQLGYCDSDVTVCLLFWNMPIIQDRDVKFPYKRYAYYLQAF